MVSTKSLWEPQLSHGPPFGLSGPNPPSLCSPKPLCYFFWAPGPPLLIIFPRKCGLVPCSLVPCQMHHILLNLILNCQPRGLGCHMDCPKDHLSLPMNLLRISQFGRCSSWQVGDKRDFFPPRWICPWGPEVKPQRD